MTCEGCVFWKGDSSTYMADCGLPGVSYGRKQFDDGVGCPGFVAKELPHAHDMSVAVPPVSEEPVADIGLSPLKAKFKEFMQRNRSLVDNDMIKASDIAEAHPGGGYSVPQEYTRKMLEALAIPAQRRHLYQPILMHNFYDPSLDASEFTFERRNRIIHASEGRIQFRCSEDQPWQDLGSGCFRMTYGRVKIDPVPGEIDTEMSVVRYNVTLERPHITVDSVYADGVKYNKEIAERMLNDLFGCTTVHMLTGSNATDDTTETPRSSACVPGVSDTGGSD